MSTGSAYTGPLRLWPVGVAVAVLGVGIWGFHTQVIGGHVTECGFDSQGAYAKVRVNNLLGGDNYRMAYVFFSVAGQPEAYGERGVRVHEPAHGHGTGVAHAGFPPHGSVAGHTVYVLGRSYDHPRFVTKKVALKLKHHRVSIETVPANPSVLRCRVETED
ncbi:MAG TPA: hypothetical protein VFL67_12315 [Mycobacterium sp.]|nr:hypothetical protein [Mycobacterium sp.]